MRYTRGYRWILSVNPRYRYVYTLCACTVLALLWLFLLYIPMEKWTLRLEQETRQFKKDGEVYVEQQAACKKMVDDIERMSKDISSFNSASCISTYIEAIMQHTQQAGMHLISLNVVSSKDRVRYISEHLKFSAVGTLPAIVTFFTSLAEKRLLIQSDDVTLQRQADDTYIMHCVLRCMLPGRAESEEIKSPSTLKKAEGLGG